MVRHHLKKLVVSLMKRVYADFIVHPQVYEQRAGQARRQTDQVDEERAFEPFEVSENEEEAVAEHDAIYVWQAWRIYLCAWPYPIPMPRLSHPLNGPYSHFPDASCTDSDSKTYDNVQRVMADAPIYI